MKIMLKSIGLLITGLLVAVIIYPLCSALQCNFDDIMDIIPEKDEK